MNCKVCTNDFNSSIHRTLIKYHLVYLRLSLVLSKTVHDVKPGHLDEYLVNCGRLVNELQRKEQLCELVASFKVEIGDQDQVVNIWRYKSGYPTASRVHRLLRTDSDLNNLVKDEAQLLRKRENQFMMAFSFWGHAQPSTRNCNYEMRSYILKPGTMIEWGNNW